MFQLIAFAKFCSHLPHEEIARLYASMGLDGVDPPVRARDRFISPDQAPTKLPEVSALFADHGLSLPRIVTSITRADDEARMVLEGCQKAGIGDIRLGAWPISAGEDARQRLDQARRDLDQLQPLLEQYQVRAAIQNHYGRELSANASACLRMVEHCDPSLLGVQLDTGHLALGGAQFDLAVDLLGPYLHHVNLKGSRWELVADKTTNELTRASAIMPLRDGACDFRAALGKIHEVGHDRPLCIHAEYRASFYRVEQDVDATARLLAEDVTYLRRIMSEELG